MSRAHPNSSPTIALLALALSVVAGLGCTSDDLLAATDGTTAIPDLTTTTAVPFTTGEVDETTTTGPPPDSDTTCREALYCWLNCAINIPDPTPPEYEFGCFLECEGDLSTEEWLKLIDFATCLFDYCENVAMLCPDKDGEETCRMCLLSGVGDVPPMGCEIQGQECK